MDDDKDDKSIVEKTLEAVKDIAVVAADTRPLGLGRVVRLRRGSTFP